MFHLLPMPEGLAGGITIPGAGPESSWVAWSIADPGNQPRALAPRASEGARDIAYHWKGARPVGTPRGQRTDRLR